MISYVFDYSRLARKFMLKHEVRIKQDKIEDALIHAIRRLTNEEVNSSDVIRMKGPFKEYCRLRIGDIRIVFKYSLGTIRIVSIHEIDFRGNIYL
jgi:mRNA-degrading endonuclease RelE of RelBE toxin-antitoxin system